MCWYPTENLLRLKGRGYTAPEELTAWQPCLGLTYKENCMPAVKKPVHGNLSLLGLASDLANLSKVIEWNALVNRRFELHQSDSRAKRCCVQPLNALRVTHGTAQIK